MCSPGDVNVLQWNREWFFLRRVKFDSGFNVMAEYEVSWHGPKVINCFTGVRKQVVRWWWKRRFWFSKKIKVTFSLNWSLPYQGGCSQVLISSRKFDWSICDWKIISPFSLRNITSFALSLFRVDFRCVHRLQLLKVCNQYVTLPKSPRVESVSEEQSRKNFLSKLMDSGLVRHSYRVILNQWTKWNNRFFKWFPKTSSIGRLPIRK